MYVYLKSVVHMVNVFGRRYHRKCDIFLIEYVTNEMVFNKVRTKPILPDRLNQVLVGFHVHLLRKACVEYNLVIGRTH